MTSLHGTAPATTIPYALTRLGTIMTAEPDNPLEAEGVLNPGTAWGPDGALYLYPRVVAAGNNRASGATRGGCSHYLTCESFRRRRAQFRSLA